MILFVYLIPFMELGLSTTHAALSGVDLKINFGSTL